MNLFRKPVNFYELLLTQCDCMSRGMKALYDFCKTKEDKYADLVIEIEDEGDMKRRIVIDELNNTLITPIERNDIFDLSRQIDEILDYAKTTGDEFRLFKIEPNDDICNMVSILLDITNHISKAIANMEKHKNIAKDEAILVKGLENKVAESCVNALANLFQKDDWREVFKYREIYRHLNTTSDIADVAMDSLLDIINNI